MLRRVAAFCQPLRPVLLLVSFPRSRSPVVGVLGLCWMWQDVPFARKRHPVVGGVVLVVVGFVFAGHRPTPWRVRQTCGYSRTRTVVHGCFLWRHTVVHAKI